MDDAGRPQWPTAHAGKVPVTPSVISSEPARFGRMSAPVCQNECAKRRKPWVGGPRRLDAAARSAAIYRECNERCMPVVVEEGTPDPGRPVEHSLEPTNVGPVQRARDYRSRSPRGMSERTYRSRSPRGMSDSERAYRSRELLSVSDIAPNRHATRLPRWAKRIHRSSNASSAMEPPRRCQRVTCKRMYATPLASVSWVTHSGASENSSNSPVSSSMVSPLRFFSSTR